MVPNKKTLPLEISAAPFNWVLLQALSAHGAKVFPQFGGLCDTASVWMLVQALSEHEAKLFTQTLCPSTFKGSAPCFTAEANSLIRLLKWTDGVDVMAMPRAFLSANKTTISRFLDLQLSQYRQASPLHLSSTSRHSQWLSQLHLRIDFQRQI